MSKGVSAKVTYKPYSQSEMWLLPPSLDELVPQDHCVRTVSNTIDELHIEGIFEKYAKGGGASRYNPVMLVKILIYGYMTGLFSSRKLGKAVKENIYYMWLAGNQKPDFRTINAFRGKELKETVEEIFVAVVKLLNQKGYVQLQNYFVDGTKIESAANKYTFVWRRAVEKNETKLDKNLRELLKEIDEENNAENAQYGENDLAEFQEHEPITSEEIKDFAAVLREKLEKMADEKIEAKKKLKKVIKKLETDFIPRKEKYECYNETFKGRNSFSKTDKDATFMRMKEDAMLNGQLKPGYNIQVGTENCFVIGYDIFSNPTDTKTLKPHLENMKKRLGKKFETVIADAGYGSEENYDYFEEEQITAAVKYAMYHKEQKKSFKKKIFNTENWNYNSEMKEYTCPAGNPVPYKKTIIKKNESGYKQTVERYECENCEGCPFRTECTKSAYGRIVQRNENWLSHKQKVKNILSQEKYHELMKRRSVECETIFGQTKGNLGFRRFQLRGKEKVSTEWGLLMIGHDIKELARSK